MIVYSDTASWPSWLDWLPKGLYSWEAWVAIGTLALALMTWRLARATRSLAQRTAQDVRASIRTAETAEAELAMSMRPYLVEVPPGRYTRTVPMSGNFLVPLDRQGPQRFREIDDGDIDIDVYDDTELHVEIPLRNAGQGIAFLDEPRLDLDVGGIELHGVTLSTAVPAGEITRLDFRGTWATIEEALPYKEALAAEGATVSASIRYTDAAGRQGTTTEVTLRRVMRGEERDDWVVERLELTNDGETQPFAVLSGRTVQRGAAGDAD